MVAFEETKEWDKIVKSFEKYDVYYLNGYTMAFQLHSDGVPQLFYFNNTQMRAMNVVMKRDIAEDKHFAGNVKKNTYFDFATPYGYGGFIIEGEITEDNLKCLDEEYTLICKNSGIISEFTRFHPVLKNYEVVEGIYKTLTLGKTITMDLSSIEQIWSNLSHQNRTNIRKAKDLGVNIGWGREPELFEKFREMYNVTMNYDNAKSYYYFKKDFYDSILRNLEDSSLIFYATSEEKIIAVSLVLYTNKQIHLHLCASDREYMHLAPNNLLYYQVACWGCDNGYTSLHMGSGVGGKEDSLYRFKKGFNRKSDTYLIIGEKKFDENKYNILTNYRKQEQDYDEDTSFIPAYRDENGG